jgi:hypothetical protein
MPSWSGQGEPHVSFAPSQNFEKWLLASSCLSVCLSVRMNQMGSHSTDFHRIWHLRIFRKPVEKIQVSLKSDKYKGYFTWRPMCVYYNLSSNSSENEKCFIQSCRENQNTPYAQCLFTEKSCHLWNNVEKHGRVRQETWQYNTAHALCMLDN